MDKLSARNKDTAAFAMWAIISNPTAMTEQEVARQLVLDGVDIRPPDPMTGDPSRPRDERKPLQEGLVVFVNGKGCTANQQLCKDLSFSPSKPLFLVVHRIEKSDNIDEKIRIILKPLGFDDGKVGNTQFEFEAPYHIQSKGLTTKLEGARVQITKHEAKIAASEAAIESLTAAAEKFRLEGKERSAVSAGKKIDAERKKIVKYKAKIAAYEVKIGSLKVELRDNSLYPNEALGIYRTGFDSLGAYQKYLGEYNAKEKLVCVYKRGGDADTPKLRSDFADLTYEQRQMETEIFGQFGDLVKDDELSKYAYNYYEGPLYGAKFAVSDGRLTFKMDTRKSRGGPTSMSPAFGKIYWIGKRRDIPSGWEDELRTRLEA